MDGLPLAEEEHPGLRLAAEARAEAESLGGVLETAILIKDLRDVYKATVTGKLGNVVRLLKAIELCLVQPNAPTATGQRASIIDTSGANGSDDRDSIASTSSDSPTRPTKRARTLGPRTLAGDASITTTVLPPAQPSSSSSVFSPPSHDARGSKRDASGLARAGPKPQKRFANAKCERCGNTKVLDQCHGFIREAGLACQRFADMPDGQYKLSHYRSLYHWRCPHRTCDFHVARTCKATIAEGAYLLSYEQREELVWKHQRECTHERVQRTELTRR